MSKPDTPPTIKRLLTALEHAIKPLLERNERDSTICEEHDQQDNPTPKETAIYMQLEEDAYISDQIAHHAETLLEDLQERYK